MTKNVTYLKMESREFQFIRHTLNLSDAGLSEILGFCRRTVTMYGQGKVGIPQRVARMLRVIMWRRDIDYPARLRRAATPLELPTDASLSRFKRGGRRIDVVASDVVPEFRDETPVQRELRYIFARLELSQSAVAKTLGVTRAAVSAWFMVDAPEPASLMLRVLRLATELNQIVKLGVSPDLDLLEQLRHAPAVVVPDCFDPPSRPHGRPRITARHVAFQQPSALPD